MREVKHLAVTFAEIIIVVALAIFAVGNIRSARYNFAGASFPGNVWWIAVGSALLGFLFALLLGSSRSVAGLRGRGLRRQQEQSEENWLALRREHERLRGEYARVATERDHYRSMLASAAPAGQMTTPTTQTATPAEATPARDNAVMDGQPRTDTQQRGDMQPQTATPAATDTQQEQSDTAPDRRWSAPFRVWRTGRQPDDTEMPTGTSAPMA